MSLLLSVRAINHLESLFKPLIAVLYDERWVMGVCVCVCVQDALLDFFQGVYPLLSSFQATAMPLSHAFNCCIIQKLSESAQVFYLYYKKDDIVIMVFVPSLDIILIDFNTSRGIRLVQSQQ
jgi:hypothetical protein